MKSARYVGTDERFLGQTATLRASEVDGKVWAQFDIPVDWKLDERGNPLAPDLIPRECSGWTEFDAADFRDVSEQVNEVTPL